jgi:hypothetical protein
VEGLEIGFFRRPRLRRAKPELAYPFGLGARSPLPVGRVGLSAEASRDNYSGFALDRLLSKDQGSRS